MIKHHCDMDTPPKPKLNTPVTTIHAMACNLNVNDCHYALVDLVAIASFFFCVSYNTHSHDVPIINAPI